jgi:hypothetical protein
MPAPKVPHGFILTKQACERFNRSHRQLNRDRVRAMNIGDEKTTSHFKLQIEDGQLLEGGELTVDEVSKLRDEGKNPVWFVEESWMEETFGLKGQRPPSPEQPPTSKPESQAVFRDDEEGSRLGDSISTSQQTNLLRDQLRREREQNALLVEQLTIKDEQIKAGNELNKENQELTKQLHTLMANLQQSLNADGVLITVPPSNVNSSKQDVSSIEVIEVSEKSESKERGTRRKTLAQRAKPKSSSLNKTTKARKRPAKKKSQSSSKVPKKSLASTKPAKGRLAKIVSRWFSG